MTRVWAAVTCLMLAACGTGQRDEPLLLAGQTIASALTGGQQIQQMTATRASLEASGFDEALLVATVQAPQFVRAGLLKREQRGGVVFWRGQDGSIAKLDRGVVRGTTGAGYDLYSAETDGTVAAIQSRSTRPYPRTYRHLNPLNQLDVTRFFCEFTPPVPETIVVFEQSHATLKFTERCVSEQRDARGEQVSIENTFWKDQNRPIFWRSEQWISPQIGNILLERVFE